MKDQIKLTVVNTSAEAVYRRLGFLLPDRSQDGGTLAGGVDPATGRPGWYRVVLREVEPEPDASTGTLMRQGDGECFPSFDEERY